MNIEKQNLINTIGESITRGTDEILKLFDLIEEKKNELSTVLAEIKNKSIELDGINESIKTVSVKLSELNGVEKELVQVQETIKNLTSSFNTIESQHSEKLAEINKEMKDALDKKEQFIKETEQERIKLYELSQSLRDKEKDLNTRERDVKVIENRHLKMREKGEVVFNISQAQKLPE